MAKTKTKAKPAKKTAAEKKKEASDKKLATLNGAAPETPAEGAETDSATQNGAMVVNEEFAKKWMEWKPELIDVNAIIFGDRYRKNPGDLHGLGKSINEFGLLQPIGVEKTGKDEYKLVVGGRRVMAVRDILKLPSIPAVIFDPEVSGEDERLVRFLQMELEENTQREQPSTMEAMERGNMIARLLGRGEAAKRGVKKRDIVAKATGMSHESRRQAEIVFDAAKKKDAPEEVKEIAAKLDSGELKPSAAFKKLTESEAAELDGAGIPIPKNMRKAFVSRVAFESLIKDLQKSNREVMDICDADGGERLAMQTATGLLKSRKLEDKDRIFSKGISDLVIALGEAAPHAQCPPCAQEHKELGKHSRKCETCHGSGHISKSVWDNLEKAGDPSIEAIRKIGAKVQKESAE